MGQRDLYQEINAWTGQSERFLNALKKRLEQAESVDLIISFVMESGVRLLIDQLRSVKKLRILTGTYLNITQPWALRMLHEELSEDAEIRLFVSEGISFHPKAWIFHYKDDRPDEVIVGSSNLSRSALIDGVEWNAALHNEDVEFFKKRFENLFEQAQILDETVLEAYSASWTRPAVDSAAIRAMDAPAVSTGLKIEPRDVQIEALYALEQARKNGVKKAMVQAATGVGKTFLAAFDARKKKRVLFVAHRQEILLQAMNAFRKVHPDKTLGLLSGSQKQTDTDFVFASVMTLSQDNWLHQFDPGAFDYIVIDEFHHAVSSSYRKIVDYFQPDFLLGLTATPERMDGRDVYALCDYNIPYSITLQDAINKGILCPFHYYGIYDSTDYSSLSWKRGRYSAAELEKLYHFARERTDLILQHYKKHHPARTLGFCTSHKHAQMMKEAFEAQGIACAAVYSSSRDDRQKSLEALEKGEIQVIFCVDMFNEGVDLPDIDAVMFLRPTESPTIFLQQLGRGLRKADSKKYLTVLDFIGNYHNAGKIPALLQGTSALSGGLQCLHPPLDCQIDFDLKLIELFEQMKNNAPKASFEARFYDEFVRIKELVGRRPTRMDLFEQIEEDILMEASKKGNRNPLHNYLAFLHDKNELTDKEEALLWDSPLKDVIRLLETTRLSQMYKLPVLYAFLRSGRLGNSVSKQDLLESWKEFFARDENWKDFAGLKSYGYVKSYAQFLAIEDSAHWKTIHDNPLKFLVRSSKGLFVENEKSGLSLKAKTDSESRSLLEMQWKDILDFRTMEYRRSRFEARQQKLHQSENPSALN